MEGAPRSTGSLNNTAPAGIAIVGRPLNVTAWPDAGTMADCLSRNAM